MFYFNIKIHFSIPQPQIKLILQTKKQRRKEGKKKRTRVNCFYVTVRTIEANLTSFFLKFKIIFSVSLSGFLLWNNSAIYKKKKSYNNGIIRIFMRYDKDK